MHEPHQVRPPHALCALVCPVALFVTFRASSDRFVRQILDAPPLSGMLKDGLGPVHRTASTSGGGGGIAGGVGGIASSDGLFALVGLLKKPKDQPRILWPATAEHGPVPYEGALGCMGGGRIVVAVGGRDAPVLRRAPPKVLPPSSPLKKMKVV